MTYPIDWPPADPVTKPHVVKQSAWVTKAARSENETIENHLVAAEDFAQRIEALSQELIARITNNEIERAQFVVGQIFHLSRLAEHRLLIAHESRHLMVRVASREE